jgi:hypothetical protein
MCLQANFLNTTNYTLNIMHTLCGENRHLSKKKELAVSD